jgi:glutathione S-transferase
MKLFYAPASPFVRKVMVTAHECGVADALTLIPAVVTPTTPDAAVNLRNPLGKIPVLELPSGEQLYDSTVICEYLDGWRSQGSGLWPPEAAARRRAQCDHALAVGAIEAGILIRYETWLRPEPLRWPEWISAQGQKILAALAVLEQHCPAWDQSPDLAQITTACLWDWLAFRQILAAVPEAPALPVAFPHLDHWHQAFAQRPSMQATQPHP